MTQNDSCRAGLVFFCEKGAHRSVEACHQNAMLLRYMGFHVSIVDICRWHHSIQKCQRLQGVANTPTCEHCDPNNERSVRLWTHGVAEFFETVLLADELDG